MAELEAPGVKVEGGGVDGEGLGVAGDLVVRLIDGIADDGEAELPKVSADLIGAAGEGTGFDEGGVVRKAFEHVEFGAGGEAIREVDVAGAGFTRFG